jgi:hypothetical protein
MCDGGFWRFAEAGRAGQNEGHIIFMAFLVSFFLPKKNENRVKGLVSPLRREWQLSMYQIRNYR